MGNALKHLREFLEKRGLDLDKRTLTSLLILLLLLVLLPIGLFLTRSELTFFPRAAGELIQLGEGGCIKLNKDKKKVVDCTVVPLKLVNPFFNISNRSSVPSSTTTASVLASSSPGSSAGASASPSPSISTTPQVIRVTGNSSTQIQAALDQLRTSGGAVYVPAGTYTINKKVQLYSNVTLFGDGIDQTIFDAGIEIDEGEAVVGNDTDEGQSNVTIRDITIKGHQLGSAEGIKLRNLDRGFVVNVKVERTNTGLLLGFHNGIGVKNVRIANCQVNNTVDHGIFMTLGENNVIDHCNINAGGTDSLGIGLEIAVDGKIANNKVISNTVSNGGHSYSLTSGNDANSDPSWINTANIVCYNNASGNNIQQIWDQKALNNVYVGNGVPVVNVNSQGYEEKGGTDPRCDIPALYNIPNAPAKPTADSSSWIGKLIGTVLAQDSDDNFTGTSGDDSDDVFTGARVGASVNPSGSTSTASPAASGGTTSGIVRYRLAESQAGLSSAQWKELVFTQTNNSSLSWMPSFVGNVFAQDSDDVFTGASDSNARPSSSPGGSTSGPVSSGNPSFSVGKQFITTNYQLTDTKVGAKQIWVEYMHPDGSSRVDHVIFDLVDKVPQITGLTCNLDISKQSLRVTIDGNYFGTAIGTAPSVTPAATTEIQGWTNKQIIASLKNPNIPINQGQRFQMKVVRPDGFESPVAICAVDKSLVSLGARIFCREPGKFDASDVDVTLISSADSAGKVNKVDETVTISKDGEISQLKTQLQVGKNYAISIKVPGSLRRTATFTASEGTTQITRPDGTPFILPVGDIAPKISVDGQINTLDRAELIRQWKILGTGDAKQSGDFNRDTKVNSIDWACMQYDFGSSDEALPAEVGGSASNTIKIPESASGTITIPVTSPSPSPTRGPSPSPSPSPSRSPSPSSSPSASPSPSPNSSVFSDSSGSVKIFIDESFVII